MNPPELLSLTREKAILHRYLTALGAPVRPAVAVVGRPAGARADGTPIVGAADLDGLLAETTGEVDLWAAGAVTRHRLEAGRLVDRAGRSRDAAALHAEFLAGVDPPLLLITRRPPGDPPLYRIATLVQPDGRVEARAEGGDAPEEATRLAEGLAPFLMPLRAIRWTLAWEDDGPVVVDAESRVDSQVARSTHG